MHGQGKVLSPQEARRNMQYWADMRAPKGEPLGGPDGVGASFLQAAAEAIPQPDATYDVVGALARCLTSCLIGTQAPHTCHGHQPTVPGMVCWSLAAWEIWPILLGLALLVLHVLACWHTALGMRVVWRVSGCAPWYTHPTHAWRAASTTTTRAWYLTPASRVACLLCLTGVLSTARMS